MMYNQGGNCMVGKYEKQQWTMVGMLGFYNSFLQVWAAMNIFSSKTEIITQQLNDEKERKKEKKTRIKKKEYKQNR